MNLDVEDDIKSQIEKVITSEDSPVGIDAKKNSHYHHKQTS